MRAGRLGGKFLAALAFAWLPLLAACAMIQIAPPTPGPGTPTTGPTHTPEPSQTPTPDLQATQDAARFRETVQAFQTESAAENATERAATARPTITATLATGPSPTPFPVPELEAIQISNLQRLEQLDLFPIDSIESVAFLEGSGLLEIRTPEEIVLYDMEALREIGRFLRTSTSAVAISRDKTLLVTGGEDGTVTVENLPAGERQVLTDEFLGISAVAVSPDNSLVAALTREGDLKIWDRQEGVELVSFFTRFYFDYASFGDWLSFSPSGDRIAAFASQSASLLVWNTDGLLGTDAEPEMIAWREPLFEAKRYRVSPVWDSTVWWRDNAVRVVDLDGQPRGDALTLPAPVLEGRYHPQGQTFFVVFEDPRDGGVFATLETLDLAEPERKNAFAAAGRITAWQLSPNGRQAAIGFEDGRLVLWDATTGQVVYELAGHNGRVAGLAFSPDGKILASTAADGTLRLWGVASGGPLATLPASAGEGSWMAFSGGGKVLVLVSELGQVRLLGVRP